MANVDLAIFARTAFSGGDCYLGISPQGRLLRPIYSTNAYKSWREGKFELGDLVRFQVRYQPPDVYTAYPHCNEDILVTKYPEKLGETSHTKLYDRLADCSIDVAELPEAFGGEICNDKYVFEQEDVSSVEVLRCDESDLELFEGDRGLRLSVAPEDEGWEYDFPVTAREWDTPDPYRNSEALVTLGLGRPIRGGKCYILVLDIFIKDDI